MNEVIEFPLKNRIKSYKCVHLIRIYNFIKNNQKCVDYKENASDYLKMLMLLTEVTKRPEYVKMRQETRIKYINLIRTIRNDYEKKFKPYEAST